MERFTITIEECPDYSLDIDANNEEQAIRAVKTLYMNRGEKYFKTNGKKLEGDK